VTSTLPPEDVEALKQMLAQRDALIAKLLAEIARLRRWQFGRSSERLEARLAQLQLALGDLPDAPPISERVQASLPAMDSTQQPPSSRVLPLRRAPRAFPTHLPRETIMHEPASCHCPECGSTMRELGQDVSEMLDLVPGYFKVIRHVRPKYSCGRCARVTQASAPARPLERAMAAPGLLTQIIVAKYADHCVPRTRPPP
jgi:transposase